MKVAVVGGGIFGTTAALVARRAGHEVEIFEELGDILQAASGINQYRLHRGYHYPRSAGTAASAFAATQSFCEEYKESIVVGGEHWYAISKTDSLVSGDEFLAFCASQGLPYEFVDASEVVNTDAVEFVIRADEARFDPNLLRELVRARLVEQAIPLHLHTRPARTDLEQFDAVIIAAYAGLNRTQHELTGSSDIHQYEVCEKPVVALPSSFGQTDLVIMDGPFMCVDPLGKSGLYVLGNVVHAIHAANVGHMPEIPPELAPVLNRGIVENPPVTKFDAFIETGSKFIPILKEAKHVGSLYTVRTVLPGLDKTDARPTLVTKIDDRHIKIFSGKIGNCVIAAREAVALL